MWYKLSGKTNMAIWITLSGLAVTALVIVLFMPKYSYWAAAFGHLASYVVMFVISAVLGAKYYPIPYRWGRLLLIFVAMGGVYGLSLLLDGAFSGWSLALKLGVHTILILFYLALAWGIIRKKS
jgi:O-antigen/teichoic acid export membrane protein